MIFVAEGESNHNASPHDTNAMGSNYSAVVFAVISLILYVLFLRPTTDQNNNERGQAAQAVAGGGSRTAAAAARRRGNHENGPAAPVRPQQQLIARAKPLSDAAMEVLSKCQSKPHHMKDSMKVTDMRIGGSNVLVDGLVGFSTTKANIVEQDAATKRIQLKERAKILSQLLKAAGALTTPPAKGANMVIGISQKQLSGEDCAVLAKVVANLATNYTLLVIVQVDNQSQKDYASAQKVQDTVIKQLRNHSFLSEAILPSHRILLSNSATGRVALVRQLSTVELVVDFDAEVQTQLERFGYKVAVVPEWKASFSWTLTPST